MARGIWMDISPHLKGIQCKQKRTSFHFKTSTSNNWDPITPNLRNTIHFLSSKKTSLTNLAKLLAHILPKTRASPNSSSKRMKKDVVLISKRKTTSIVFSMPTATWLTTVHPTTMKSGSAKRRKESSTIWKVMDSTKLLNSQLVNGSGTRTGGFWNTVKQKDRRLSREFSQSKILRWKRISMI